MSWQAVTAAAAVATTGLMFVSALSQARAARRTEHFVNRSADLNAALTERDVEISRQNVELQVTQVKEQGRRVSAQTTADYAAAGVTLGSESVAAVMVENAAQVTRAVSQIERAGRLGQEGMRIDNVLSSRELTQQAQNARTARTSAFINFGVGVGATLLTLGTQYRDMPTIGGGGGQSLSMSSGSRPVS